MAENTFNAIWRWAEPPVEEMLADPLVHLVMERDGISRDDILRLLRSIPRPAARETSETVRSV